MSKSAETAKAILAQVGGRQNVSNAYHCMTRLRLMLNDKSKVNEAELKNIPGVMGLSGKEGELQVILGPAVDGVYREFAVQAGLEEAFVGNQNPGPEFQEKPKFSFKAILNGIMGVFSASMSPLVPLFVVIGMANVVAAIIGPTMLDLVSDTDPLYTNFYYIGQAIVYFLPVLVAVTASRHFKANVFISVALAFIMLYPDMISALEAEGGYAIFGISAPNVAYSGQIIHVLLIVWVQSWVERFLAKHIPKALNVLLVPFGTVVIMLPLSFCLLGPLGFNIGSLLCAAVLKLYQYAGPIETALVCAVVPFLTAFGIGRPIFFVCLTMLMAEGVEYAYMPIAMVLNNFLAMGCCAGYIFRTKSPGKRQYGITSLIANALGGVSEPALFGIILPDPKTYLPLVAGGAASGLYLGIMKVGYYAFGPSNVLSVLGFVNPAGGSNLLYGCIASAIAFFVTFAMMLIFYKDNDTETMKKN